MNIAAYPRYHLFLLAEFFRRRAERVVPMNLEKNKAANEDGQESGMGHDTQWVAPVIIVIMIIYRRLQKHTPECNRN